MPITTNRLLNLAVNCLLAGAVCVEVAAVVERPAVSRRHINRPAVLTPATPEEELLWRLRQAQQQRAAERRDMR